jgi:hypothetical protein
MINRFNLVIKIGEYLTIFDYFVIYSRIYPVWTVQNLTDNSELVIDTIEPQACSNNVIITKMFMMKKPERKYLFV